MIFGPDQAAGPLPPGGNGSAPRCGHLDGLTPVAPQSDGCRACAARPGRPDRPAPPDRPASADRPALPDRPGPQHRAARQHRPDRRVTLLACLTCGWVACSDDAPGQHARAHYEETDHPVARGLVRGSGWTWCYVHQRRI